MIHYTCPVCAYTQMPYQAAEGNICPCCGTEFGYDDTMGVTFRDLRDRWVAQRTPWFSPVDQPPPLWNGVAQLILADYEFAMAPWMEAPPQVQRVLVVGNRVRALARPVAA